MGFLEFIGLGRESYMHIQWRIFKESFTSMNVMLLFMVVLDMLLYFVLKFVGELYVSSLEAKGGVAQPSNLMALNQTQAVSFLSEVRGTFFFIVAATLLTIVIMSVLFGLAKSLQWQWVAKRSFSPLFVKQLVLIATIWIPAWMFVLLLIAFIFEPGAAQLFLFIVTLIMLYYSSILFALFAKFPHFKIVYRVFPLGLLHFHYFAIPLTVFVVVNLAISGIFSYFANLGFYSPIVYGVVFLFTIAWLRYYMFAMAIQVLK